MRSYVSHRGEAVGERVGACWERWCSVFCVDYVARGWMGSCGRRDEVTIEGKKEGLLISL